MRISIILSMLSVVLLIAAMAFTMAYGNARGWPDWLMCTVWNALGMALIACSVWLVYARWKKNNETEDG